MRVASRMRPEGRCYDQNVTRIGTLTLTSTFDCVSVRAGFTGDANATNTATIQYRTTGAGAWLDAYPPIVDRRATISGSPNPYVNEFRGSIVGLAPGTAYEVLVTYADPDGVSGGSTQSGTVSTLATVPPLGGTIWYVDDVEVNGDGSTGSPFNAIDNGISAASNGDTVVIRAGTYPPFTISKSGADGAWIALVGEDRDTTIISGGAVTNNITISANYIQIKNLRFKQTISNSIYLSTGAHHVWLDNLHHEDISSGQGYNDAGVQAIGGNSHIYVLNSQFHSATSTANPTSGPSAPVCGVYVRGTQGVEGTWVIKGNTFDGGFRDAIGNTPESAGTYLGNNTDIANNTFSGFKDDAIQIEGDDMNLRIWGNDITIGTGAAAVATESSFVGPVYIFRNVIRGASAFKVGGAVSTFYFHNTIDGRGDSSDAFAANASTSGQVLLNNIIAATGNPLYYMGSSGDGRYDYNLYVRTPSGNVVRLWNGTDTYASVAAFTAATGQEAHGLEGDPLFLNIAKQIGATSPAHDAGAVLANFNDAASAWPADGAAPDMGAYEVTEI